MPFLPISKDELNSLGIEQPDFVLVTGDAYVDHPSFGAAVIGRVLQNGGYSVGIIAQPDWNNLESFDVFGKPRLGFLVTSGNIDSMVNHYTVAKKRREKDFYSPGGKAGLRPDRATIVYSNKVRELYKDCPIIIGGVEASLRRLAHYDYWSDSVRRSCLLDSGADLLIYGMGERQIIEMADALSRGLNIFDLSFIKGTAYKTKDISLLSDFVELPTYEHVKSDKAAYNKSFKIQYENTDAITAKTLIQRHGNVWVVQNPPAMPLSENEMDAVYSLKYERRPHPVYEKNGGVPAIEEVKFSLISSRGCFGGCNFCALTFHQGRTVSSRSHKSLLAEAEKVINEPDFKGYIHDVGGPTANFRKPSCKKQLKSGVCANKRCIAPKPCANLEIDHTDYLNLLRKLRELPGVKKVFVRSGLRYDYLIMDKNTKFFEELCKHHISGQLKVAPEHISPRVLERMGKPGRNIYDRFVQKYYEINKKLGMNQFLVPYLMSSHPGSDLNAAVELAEYLRDMGISPEQVQDFYPTPGTLSTCVYYTGVDPLTGETVYVPKNAHEKAMQRALIQYRLPQNYSLVYEALQKTNRQDLIGFNKKCLIRPRVVKNTKQKQINQKKDIKPVKQKTIKKKTIRNVHKKKK